MEEEWWKVKAGIKTRISKPTDEEKETLLNAGFTVTKTVTERTKEGAETKITTYSPLTYAESKKHRELLIEKGQQQGFSFEISPSLEKDLLLVRSKERPNTFIVTGLQPTTYSFLQNIQRLKGELYKQCLTMEPVKRVDEQTVIMNIVKRPGCQVNLDEE